MKLSDLARDRRGDRIADAIKAKYGTPSAVLRRLGIDAALPEKETEMTAEQVLLQLQNSLKDLPPGDMTDQISTVDIIEENECRNCVGRPSGIFIFRR